jgi:hypothetical protein
MMSWHLSVRRSAACVALLLVHLWPGLYNGQPFFFPDTTAYVRGADVGFSRITHHHTIWSRASTPPATAADNQAGTGAGTRPPPEAAATKGVLAGRSVYYGGLLYLGHITGRFWLATLAQAAAVVLAIALTLQSLGLFSWLRLTFICLALTAATPVAFFSSFLMPDVFAGITILAVANLLVLQRRMPLWEMVTWVGLLGAALLFHASHLLVALAMLGAGLAGVMVARAPIPWKGIGGVVVAITFALIGEAAFNFGVARLTGSAPIRPPFLMARMIADGPGHRYLTTHCPGAQLVICRFVRQLPMSDADAFLWSTNPANGVFAIADPLTRRRLADEQYRFAWATLAFDPLGQAVAAVRNTAKQIGLVGLSDFNYDAQTRRFLSERVPRFYMEELKATRAWSQTMPTRVMSGVIRASAVLAALYLLGCALALGKAALRDRMLVLAAALVGGTIVNAAVCGTLSSPADRYQARVIWLLPLAAMLVSQRPRAASWRRSHPPVQARQAAAGSVA